MSEKIVNLINIKVKPDACMEIELLYKEREITSDTKIYLVNELNKKMFPQKEITAFQDEVKKIKVVFEIELTHLDKLQVQIENNKETYKVRLLDNKDEDIYEKPNQYVIFTKKHTFSIEPNNATFLTQNRKFGDKFLYELNKQKYAIKKYHHPYLLRLLKRKERYYLFNDKIMYGDDNAEQLFIHINQKHKDIAKKCYFVLDKKSDRISQIKKIGKVVYYGSLRHKIIYLNSKMVISSHASYYDKVFNPFSEPEMDIYKDIICKYFIFLQHGVIENDLHDMLNRCNILADLFITTTSKEYEDLKTDKYLYDEDMIKCTGLARFDRLINERKKVILIAPTWRAYLTQAEYTDDKGNDFKKSQFYQEYQLLLQNKKLLNELEKQGYKIKFLLHPVFAKYKELFMKLANNYIEILTNEDIKYSQVFKECSMLITDYSSIHFDVAFLKKPIIYFQFDKEKYYQSHYSKGFFSYETDGFGPVIETGEELVDKIIYYIQNDCKIEDKYEDIIKNTFYYLDYNNSERIYQEIIKLSKKSEKNYRFNNVH